MDRLPFNSVDLIMTSPPYAEQRKQVYGGVGETEYVDWFYARAEKMYRILKPTGSFVLNIKEHVSAGVRSFYVWHLVEKLGGLFRFSDTYIWVKTNPFPTGNPRRLKDGFEYCFWFTKTPQYKFFPNNVLTPSTSVWLESEKRRKNMGEHNCTNGSGMNMNKRCSPDLVRPSNVITLPTDTTNHLHPAVFPTGLPRFFINLMTEPSDLVLDPFCGSGTTLLASSMLERKFIGMDIYPQYVEISRLRLGIE